MSISDYEPLFGEWYVESLIGAGTFGKVYKIKREDYGRSYYSALKWISIPNNKAEVKNLRCDGMDADSISGYFSDIVRDLTNEIQLMSRLRGQSCIVSYEDHKIIPKSNGIGFNIFIRMELLTSLNDHMLEHPYSSRDIIHLGINICEALEICQRYNIIHRDIKPDNIFVTDLGDYKLGDFGIARQLERTMSNMSTKGTFNYMAPEVYKQLRYDSSVDLYSLGIVLYRLLNNGRLPFLPLAPNPIIPADRDESIVRRLSGEPMPFPQNAPGRLGEIILKACAYDPRDRYISPKHLRHDLEAIQFQQSEYNNPYEQIYDTPSYISTTVKPDKTTTQTIGCTGRVSESAFAAQLSMYEKDTSISKTQGTRTLFSSAEKSLSNANAAQKRNISGATLQREKEEERQNDREQEKQAKKRGWRLIVISSGLAVCVVTVAIVLALNRGKIQQESYQTAGAEVTAAILPDHTANGVTITGEIAEGLDLSTSSMETPSTVDISTPIPSPLPTPTQYPQQYFPLDIKSAVVARRYYALAANGDQGYIIYIQPSGKVSVNPIWETGYPFDLSQLSDWTDIIAVSANCLHVVGLKADGTVVAAGSNNYGQCNVSTWKGIIAVSAGLEHTVGLKSDGAVVATGWNEDGQCNISEWADIVAISAGDMHTVGIKSNGTAVAKGWNYFDQCRVYPWRNIAAVAAGDHHTVGLTTNGTVVAVGQNHFGECDVSGWSDIVAIAAGERYTVGLKSNGTVVATGENSSGQIDAIAEWEDVVAIYESMGRVFGVKTDGTVLTNVTP